MVCVSLLHLGTWDRLGHDRIGPRDSRQNPLITEYTLDLIRVPMIV